MQHESGKSMADNSTSIELSLDASSKSTSNLALSRQRPVSVPVHTMAADPAFRKLVRQQILLSICMIAFDVPAVPVGGD